jgi:hypothetical protein
MKQVCRPSVAILSFFVWVSLLLPGCRSTPVGPPPESTQEIPEILPSKPEIPGEFSPPATRSTAPEPPPDVISRNLPESRIGKPAKDFVARRVEYNTLLHSRANEPSRNGTGWRYRATRQGEIVGFEFANHGGNRILPPRHNAVKNQFFSRDFQFRFDERARQDIHLLVSDWVASRDRTFRLSDLMNSLMLFFPRNVLPAIVSSGSRNIVTLPTGEEVEFDAATHEISAGVLSETPVDLNPDRALRNFPGIQYFGKGVVIRANARGADPRINTTAIITNGAAAQTCDQAIDCERCQVPAKELWDQSGAARFKFARDADFDRFLVSRCGFGLPRVGTAYAIATPIR